jgi:hypothetical protein
MEGITKTNKFKITFGEVTQRFFVERWTRFRGYPTAEFFWIQELGWRFTTEAEAIKYISKYKKAKILSGNKFVSLDQYKTLQEAGKR